MYTQTFLTAVLSLRLLHSISAHVVMADKLQLKGDLEVFGRDRGVARRLTTYAETESNSCAFAGYSTIMSAADCTLAASALDFDYEGLASEDFYNTDQVPYGCYKSWFSDSVYYNSDITSSVICSSYPFTGYSESCLCLASGSPSPTTPSPTAAATPSPTAAATPSPTAATRAPTPSPTKCSSDATIEVTGPVADDLIYATDSLEITWTTDDCVSSTEMVLLYVPILLFFHESNLLRLPSFLPSFFIFFYFCSNMIFITLRIGSGWEGLGISH